MRAGEQRRRGRKQTSWLGKEDKLAWKAGNCHQIYRPNRSISRPQITVNNPAPSHRPRSYRPSSCSTRLSLLLYFRFAARLLPEENPSPRSTGVILPLCAVAGNELDRSTNKPLPGMPQPAFINHTRRASSSSCHYSRCHYGSFIVMLLTLPKKVM